MRARHKRVRPFTFSMNNIFVKLRVNYVVENGRFIKVCTASKSVLKNTKIEKVDLFLTFVVMVYKLKTTNYLPEISGGFHKKYLTLTNFTSLGQN